jgi:hypothetical protein
MLCPQTWIVIFIAFLGILFDYEIGGAKPSVFFSDIAISLFLIVLVQWFCSNNGIAISWLVTIIFVALYFTALYLWRTKNPIFMQIIEEDQKGSKKP